MYDEQIKEFEWKLTAALKPGCEFRFWREDYGHWVCYEIGVGHNIRLVTGEILVSKLSTSHDVEVNVRAIANELPTSWCASLPSPSL